MSGIEPLTSIAGLNLHNIGFDIPETGQKICPTVGMWNQEVKKDKWIWIPDMCRNKNIIWKIRTADSVNYPSTQQVHYDISWECEN